MYILCIYVASQVLLVVKNPPANTKDVTDRVQSLSWEDPLEEGPAARCSSLGWRTPRTEEPGGLTVYRVAKSQTRLK